MRILKPILFSLVLMLGSGAAALAQPGSITVTGEATVQATPDMATISLGVTTNGATAAEAMAANTKSLTAVMDRLHGSGIADNDLQTSNLSINPNWVNDPNTGVMSISGYVASNMLNVRVRDLAALGGILDASISDGANTLNGLSFDLSQPRPAQDEARKAAVADAKARAELLASAAGVKLGHILSVSENGGYSGPQPMFRAEAAPAPVPVAAGQLGMTASVTITFEIDD